jgi:hypothetical protein
MNYFCPPCILECPNLTIPACPIIEPTICPQFDETLIHSVAAVQIATFYLLAISLVCLFALACGMCSCQRHSDKNQHTTHERLREIRQLVLDTRFDVIVFKNTYHESRLQSKEELHQVNSSIISLTTAVLQPPNVQPPVYE